MPDNDTWIRLGRDDGGRFIRPAAAGNAVASPEARARAVSYGAIGLLPSSQRGRYENHLTGGGLQRLVGSLLAWHAAGDLDDSTFRDRFLSGKGSDELVARLRKAASGVAAGTPEALQDATTDLAAAHQLLGAPMWPSFVSAAYGQAGAAEQPQGE